MSENLTIAFASSEAVPYAKTGGLGDVVGALSATLASLGHRVFVVLPFYREVKKQSRELSPTGKRLKVPISETQIEGEIFVSQPKNNLTYFLVKQDRYFDRDGIYGNADGDYTDNAERFIFFSRAVPRVLEQMQVAPHVVHCHDWQTGLVPLYFQFEERAKPLFQNAKTLFTLHNLAFQGLFWHLDMHLTGLPWSVFTPEGMEFYGKISFLKAGIVYSDLVTTVSRRYAQEIQAPEQGCGFEGILRARSEKLTGILNGVDYEEWNPQTDPYLARNYSVDDLTGKQMCKRDLLKEFGLNLPEKAPLFGVVSRLAEQKGIDLLLGAVDEIAKMGAGLVVLGVGDVSYQSRLDRAQKRVASLKVHVSFDDRLAHKVEAGCDFFLMPSKYEPCGLNQMYSLKYGTIPIVRSTGGLEDSIQNFNAATLQGNGFKFDLYETKAFLDKIREAVQVYQNENLWRALVRNAMLCDYSWEHAAKEYEKAYRKLTHVGTPEGPRRRTVGHHLHRTR